MQERLQHDEIMHNMSTHLEPGLLEVHDGIRYLDADRLYRHLHVKRPHQALRQTGQGFCK